MTLREHPELLKEYMELELEDEYEKKVKLKSEFGIVDIDEIDEDLSDQGDQKMKKITLREFPYSLLHPGCGLKRYVKGKNFLSKYCNQANLHKLFININNPRFSSNYILVGLKEDKNLIKVNTKILVERFLRDMVSQRDNLQWLGYLKSIYDHSPIEVRKIEFSMRNKKPLGKNVHWFYIKNENYPFNMSCFCRINPLYLHIPLVKDIYSFEKLKIEDKKYTVDYLFMVKNINVRYYTYEKEKDCI